ncbi:hypothetical protein C5C56_15885 [Rathayibacter sp. AY1D1]|nr:hypothetical protein C5C56_15885 [Rathayibacter sp. AY1D1]
MRGAPQVRPTCILCGSEGLTRSHIYGRTLRAEFGQERAAHQTLTNVDGRAEATVDRWESGIGMIFSQGKWLCYECNNVWMAGLEDAALPTVVNIIRGESVYFDRATTEAVASWAIIASILRAQLVPDGEPYAPAAARRFRQDGLEAAEAAVWLVSAAEDPTVRAPGTAASSYWRAPDLSGGIAQHWLKSLCVVVASGDHRDRVAERIWTLRDAALPLYPPAETRRWPSGRSAPDRVLMRATGLDERTVAARAAFRPTERPPAGRTRTIIPL